MSLDDKVIRVKYRLERFAGTLVVNRGFGLILVIFIPILAFTYFKNTFGDDRFVNNFNDVKRYIQSGGEMSPIVGEVAAESTLSLEESVFEPFLDPLYTRPKSLEIESLDIEIELVAIGVDSNGTMETPSSWDEGGWYKKGAMPGQRGNMIVNAHYDDNYGRPAAFWNLKNANVGDKVLVVDEYNRIFHYSITDIFQVNIDDPDKLDVLDSEGSKTSLTMITCGGYWIPGKSTYNRRLVVTAELVGEEESIYVGDNAGTQGM
ncbi:class F sortase [Patescibacteria group bacterium]|nr:class F sortase [Patescibacteria group bacterium]